MNSSLFLLALAFGMFASAILWQKRDERQARRALIGIWLALLAWTGFFISNQSFDVPELDNLESQSKFAFAAAVLLSINALFHVLERLVWERIVARMGDRPVPRLLVNLFHLLALIAGLLWVLVEVFDQNLTTFLVTSTVASAVIGLALQDILRSLVAGLVLQIEGPFSIGDWVEMAGQEGRIVQQNWRTLTLRTRLNHHVTLTNSSVADQEIINYSRPARLQAIDAFIGVAYDHPPEQVKAVIQEAVLSTPEVRLTPAPRVYTVKYNDFSVDYRIRFWITDYAKLREVEDAVMTRLWYALDRAGMRIPFPIRDVNLRQIPEDQVERDQRARHASIEASLRPIPLLAPLDDQQIAHVAAGASILRYAADEILMRQNAPGESLFLIRHGSVRIEVDSENGESLLVARRNPGEIIGEMSLLTGQPRSATVISDCETEVIEVHRDCFRGVLLADETIADQLCDILAMREMERDQRLEEAASIEEQKAARRDFLARVRRFFALNSES